MIRTDQEYEKMTTYQLQVIWGHAVIGSPEYNKISSILNKREIEDKVIANASLCWSRIAGIAAILALVATIVFSLISMLQTNTLR